MTKALQIKLLATLLGVLVLIAGLLAHANRPVEITPADRRLQKKLEQKVQLPDRHYLVP